MVESAAAAREGDTLRRDAGTAVLAHGGPRAKDHNHGWTNRARRCTQTVGAGQIANAVRSHPRVSPSVVERPKRVETRRPPNARIARETMHPMDDTTLAELRALQARAYGPEADIAADPGALERLEELESMLGAPAVARTANETPPAGIDPPVAVAVAVAAAPVPRDVPLASVAPSSPTESVTQEPGPTESAPVEPAPTESAPVEPAPRRRRSRWLKLWWALSLVAAAGLAAGATYGLMRVAPVSVSSGAPQVATLEPVALPDIPSGWYGVGPSSTAWEFYGMTLFETSFAMTGAGQDCFTIVRTDSLPEPDADPNSWSYNGPMYSACRVGGFAATLEMPIDASAPAELTAQFPKGGALQFVRDGDRIGVFLDQG